MKHKVMTELEALTAYAKVMRFKSAMCTANMCIFLQSRIYRNCVVCHVDRCVEHVKKSVKDAGYDVE